MAAGLPRADCMFHVEPRARGAATRQRFRRSLGFDLADRSRDRRTLPALGIETRGDRLQLQAPQRVFANALVKLDDQRQFALRTLEDANDDKSQSARLSRTSGNRGFEVLIGNLRPSPQYTERARDQLDAHQIPGARSASRMSKANNLTSKRHGRPSSRRGGQKPRAGWRWLCLHSSDRTSAAGCRRISLPPWTPGFSLPPGLKRERFHRLRL